MHKLTDHSEKLAAKLLASVSASTVSASCDRFINATLAAPSLSLSLSLSHCHRVPSGKSLENHFETAVEKADTKRNENAETTSN